MDKKKNSFKDILQWNDMLISDDWQSDFQLVPYIIKDVGVYFDGLDYWDRRHCDQSCLFIDK